MNQSCPSVMSKRTEERGVKKHWKVFNIHIHQQIRSTLGLHFTPVTMAIIKKANNNKRCQGYRERRKHLLMLGMSAGAVHMESTVETS